MNLLIVTAQQLSIKVSCFSCGNGLKAIEAVMELTFQSENSKTARGTIGIHQAAASKASDRDGVK